MVDSLFLVSIGMYLFFTVIVMYKTLNKLRYSRVVAEGDNRFLLTAIVGYIGILSICTYIYVYGMVLMDIFATELTSTVMVGYFQVPSVVIFLLPVAMYLASILVPLWILKEVTKLGSIRGVE